MWLTHMNGRYDTLDTRDDVLRPDKLCIFSLHKYLRCFTGGTGANEVDCIGLKFFATCLFAI